MAKESMTEALEKKKEGKKHTHIYKKGMCTKCGKSSKENYEELSEEDREIEKRK